MVLLSNASDALERYLTELNLESFFHLVVNSARVGVAKPDPEIFRITMQQAGSTPQESLFVDDLPWNVESATREGIHAIHHRNTDATLRQLDALLEPAEPHQARNHTVNGAEASDLPDLRRLARVLQDESWWGSVLPLAGWAELGTTVLALPQLSCFIAGEERVDGMVFLSQGNEAPERHVGEVSLGVHPENRRQGLAWSLLDASVAAAQRRGIELLRASVCSEDGAGRCMLTRHGFDLEASLAGHLRRPDGQSRDLLVYTLRL
jgi:ribosomal protein S18 acetylase RimI-like enzyme